MACVTKKRDRWAVDFYDQHGKRRLKVLPKGSTKKQARGLLREIEDQVGKRTFMPTKKIPTFAEVAKDWLEYKRPNVRQSTWDSYKAHVKYHFGELNPLKITRISTPRVEKFITDRQNEGMNLTTLRRVLVTFGQTMSYAVRHKYIDHNPVRDAERPKGQGGVEKDKIRVFSPLEAISLVEAEEDVKCRTLFRLAIFSGARQGELFGLKWTDIDWFNSQIHIQRTFNKGRWYKPKSKASNRKIDLGPVMMAELRKWKLACPPSELDLVFPNDAGKPMDHGNMLNRHFYPALKAASLPRIRFHDLRHTYASLLIEQGENVKYIQSQLGHSSPMVTMSVYAHLMSPVNQEAACRLEKTLLGESGDQMETKTKKEVKA